MTAQIKYKIEQEKPIFIIGIVTNETDLKVSWAINLALQIRLSRKDNLMPFSKKDNFLAGFAHFSFDDEQKIIHYSLVSNKVENARMFEEFRNLDFLLFIKGELKDIESELILQNIRKIKEFSTCLELKTSAIKRLERLGFI